MLLAMRGERMPVAFPWISPRKTIFETVNIWFRRYNPIMIWRRVKKNLVKFSIFFALLVFMTYVLIQETYEFAFL